METTHKWAVNAMQVRASLFFFQNDISISSCVYYL